MSIRDWLAYVRLAWEETRHVVLRAIRPTPTESTPNTVQLEDRVLLSVSPGPMMVDGDIELTGDSLESSDLQAADAKVVSSSAGQQAESTGDIAIGVLDMPADDAGSSTEESLPQELVFIDSSVDDLDQLMQAVDLSSDREFAIIQLDAQLDGVEQISAALAEYRDIEALHIVSHGSDGAIKLGNAWLSFDSTSAYAGDLVNWRDSLSSSADILIYGCDVAATAEGQTLIDSLAALTEADVSASVDRTGHESLGGDWELEYGVGQVGTEVAFDSFLQSSWYAALDVAGFQEGVGGYTGAQDTELDQAQATTDKGGNVEIRLDAISGEYQQGLIRFDNLFGGGAGQIPLGATITSATLEIYVTNDADPATVVTIHQMLETWTESSTWDGMSTSGGGIQADDVEAKLTPDDTKNSGEFDSLGWKSFDVQAGVQAWSDGSTNYGWVIISDDDNNGLTFHTSEYTDSALRPKLTVNYTLAPEISLPGSAVNYTEGDGPVVIDATATATDADSADFDGGTLTVDFTAGSTANDRLSIRNEGTGAGQIGVSGSDVTYNFGAGAVTIGTFTGGTDGSTPLVVTFNASATPAAAQALMRNITYENVSENPTTAARTVRYILTDGDGGTSAAVSETINVTAVTDHALAVDTTSDTSDGDMTSIDALLADKGADGFISLREAIVASNNTAGADTITFDIVDAGPHVISLAAALPDITGVVTIDGWSEPDFGGTPVIRIDGNSAGASVDGLSFTNTSDGSIVRGLMITRFSRHGIQVDTGADGITIVGNWIGTTGTGSTGVGNTNTGINVQGANTIIGGTGANDGNVITNNGNEGINLTGTGATGTIIQGNIIGLDPDGSTGSGNADVGIALLSGSHNTTIGGTTAAARNIISNNYEGIEINSNNNVIQGNYIGTDITGLLDRGNRSDDGIEIQNSATNITIGGSVAGAGNVISGNFGHGINIVSGTDITVQGNTIGAGVDGSNIRNDMSGVNLASAQSNSNIVIGGMQPGEGNLIAFNYERGILTSGTGGDDRIEGNTITQSGYSGIVSMRSGTTISGNLIYQNSTRTNFDEVAIGANHKLYHNTIHGAANDGLSVEGANAIIKNNIITGSAALGINVNGAGSIAEEQYNLIPDATTGSGNLGGRANVSLDATDINADPLYVDSANGDFQLVDPSSLAINAGLDLVADQPDMNGADGGLYTGTAPDMGAFESANTNVAPSISLPGGPVNYTEGDGAVVIDATATASDADSSDFDGGTLTVDFTSGGTANDRLAIRNEGTGAGQIGVSGSNVTYNFGAGAVIIGSFAGGTDGSTPLVITFNSSATPVAAQALARNITYTNVSENPNESARTVRFVLTDGDGGTNNSASQTVNVSALNDAPVLGNNALTISEGGTVTLTGSDLSATDVDGDALTYNVTNVTGGQFELSTGPGVAVTSFTQVQLDASQVVFVHDAGEAAPSYDVTVTDGTLDDGPDSASISFTNVNDAPTVGTNTGATVAEGGSVTLDSSDLAATDPDDSGVGLVYTVTGGLANGQLELSTGPGVAISSFTQDDLDNNRVVYVHDGSQTSSDSFDFSLADGGEDGAGAATGTFNFTVTNTNDAPVLGNNALSISEGGTVTLTGSDLSASDDDGDALTYNVTNVTGGQFELSTNPGVAVTSFTQVQLDASEVVFVHDGGEAAPSYDVTVTDGTLDDGPDSASISFTNVNDAPTVGTNTGATVAEGGSVTLDSSDLAATDPDDSGVGLVYTVTGGLANGQLELSTGPGVAISSFTQDDLDAGRVVYVHDGSQTSSDSFDFSLADGGEDGAGAATGTFNLTVTNTNDAPVLGNNALSISEGGTVTLTGTDLSATDDDGDALTYNLANVTGGQFELSTGPGVAVTSFTQVQLDASQVVFVHDGNEAAPSYDVTVTDGTLDDGPDSASISFTNVNDAPTVGTNTGATVAEGGSVTLDSSDLAATDPDDSGVGLVYTVTGGLANGQLELSTGPGVAISSFTQDDLDNNRVVYVHDGSQTSSDSFDFSLADGGEDGAGAATGTFNLTVTNTNDAPVLGNNALSISEGGTVTLTGTDLSATDDDGDALTYNLANVTGGQFELSTGPGVAVTSFTQVQLDASQVVFVHDAGEAAPSYDVTVTDGTLDDGPESAAITFTNVNDAPTVGTNTGATVAEGGSVTLDSSDLAAVDPDDSGVGLVYTITSAPSNGQLELSTNPGVAISSFTQDDLDNNRVVYVHDGSQTSSDSFDFSLADGGEDGAGAATGTFNFTVTNTNDAPVLGNNALTISEGGTVTLTGSDLSATDVDGDALTYNVTNVTGGQFELSTNPGVAVTSFTQVQLSANQVVFVHDAGEAAPSYDVTVTDGTLDDGPESASISFTNVNDAPTVGTNTGATVAEGGSVTLDNTDLAATDPDDSGTGLVYTVTGGLANGQLELSTGPGVAISSFTQDDLDNGRLVYVHDGSQTASDSFNFSLADGGEDGAGAATGTFNLTVTNTNDAPVLGNNALTISEGGSVTLSATELSASDDDGDALTYNVTNVSGGQFELSTNPGVAVTSFTQVQLDASQVVFVHDGGEAAPSYDVSVTDGTLDDGPDSAGISFTNVNDAPTVGTNTGATVAEGGSVMLDSFDLSASDPDDTSAGLVYTVTSGPSNGQLELSTNPGVAISSFTQDDLDNNRVVYVHDGSQTASDSFDFSLADGGEDGAGAATGTFSFTVTNTNDAPVLGNNSLTISEGGTVTLTGSELSASDADGNALTYIITNVSGGQFELSTNPGVPVSSFTQVQLSAGQVVFVHDGNEAAPSYEVAVTDGTLSDGPASAIISFTNVNDAPIANGESFTTMQMESLVVSVPGLVGNDVDVDGDAMSVVLMTGVAHGSLVANGDGSFTYIPDSTFSGTDSFTYVVTDGQASSGPVSVSITVVGVAPIVDTSPDSEPDVSESDAAEEVEEAQEAEADTDESADSAESAEQVEAAAEASSADGSPGTGAAPVSMAAYANRIGDGESRNWSTSSRSQEQSGEYETTADSGVMDNATAARYRRGAVRSITDASASSSALPILDGLVSVISSSPLTLLGTAEEWSAMVGDESGVVMEEVVLGTTAVVSTGLSIGYVIWMLRGGTLCASMVASLPAWTMIDPMPILGSFTNADDGEEEDEERLCDLVM